MTKKSLRWGDATPARSRDVARDRLLDAAETCLQVKGLSGTTMDDIARRAGVSRATVYRYFSSRESVVSGVIVRAAERYLHRISGRILGHSDLGSAVLDFVAVTVRAARREPIIGVLFGSDDELAGVGLAEGTSVALFELVAEFLRPVFAAHWDQLEAGVSVDDAAEWILRTILSLLSVRGPRHRSPEGVDAFLRRFLLPALLTNTHRCVNATTAEYYLNHGSGIGERNEALTMDFPQFNQQIAVELQNTAGATGGLSKYLDFRHTEFAAGRLVVEMDARADLLTPFGNLHGGCLSAMVDHCLGVVFYPVIPAGSWVATTEFKLNLLQPVSNGVCVAVTDIIALGKRSGVARIDITNAGRPVCAAQGTVTVVGPRARTS